MLRAVQMGLRISDLDQIEYGELTDMFIESGNDDYKYQELATQDDFNRF